MNPRVTDVKALESHEIQLTFDNGEIRVFDVTPYLDKGVFRELKDYSYFRRVRASLGTAEWPNGQDFCPDALYEISKVVVSS